MLWQKLDVTFVLFIPTGGGEYLSNAFTNYSSEHGFEKRHKVANLPFQNGSAIWINGLQLELVFSLLHSRRLPKPIWAEALATAVHVMRYYSVSNLEWNCFNAWSYSWFWMLKLVHGLNAERPETWWTCTRSNFSSICRSQQTVSINRRTDQRKSYFTRRPI